MSGQNLGRIEEVVSVEKIQSWLITKLSDQFGLEESEVGVNDAFASFGIDSAQALSMCGDLEVWLGKQLPPTLLWDYPTIQILSEHLANPSGAKEAGHEDHSEAADEPIAIIGLACRFPGAHNPTEFWNLLCEGIDAVTEVPADRWDADAFYDPDLAAVGKMNSRWGGFIGKVDGFDAQFFGISPREASRMDPQQRIMLELAWEALEDAGQVPAMLAGSRTGVFVGIGTIDYGRMQVGNLKTASNPYAGTGGALSIAANRISYVFNFRGPSVAVDTACSSSLVAAHLACQSLWSGESSLALAGGVNVIIDPKPSVALSKGGFLSPDGRCRAFDAKANGYVRAEGAGIIVLKRLSKAREDGDPVYGVIRATATNQDGHSNGLTAPNQQAQELLLRDAYRRAGISPGQVQYVETHGTGTALGDPIEVKALGTVLAIDRPEGRRCAIGSVKTNIGHAETAAGIVSLVKVALMLKHKVIPASLHFNEPNPYIPFDTLPLYVQESLSGWPEGQGPAVAGISGFGFGGTNAHLVLSEAPAVAESLSEAQDSSDRAHLLALSARSPEALKALAGEYLALARGSDASLSLEDVCYTSGARRGHYDHRLAVVARSWDEVKDRLEAFLEGETRAGMSSRRKAPGRRPKVAFVFSGQGSQRDEMGRQLLAQEPVFRAKVEECDELFRSYSGWSLLEQLYGEEASSRIDETDVTQPAIFMLQVGLVALLNSWGITPDAVVGHSMGEVAAAHITGVLSLADAVGVIYHRGRLMQLTAGQGMTAAIGLSLDEATVAIAGYGGRLSVAAHNGPKATTISGDPDALQELLASLQERNVFCQMLRVHHAFHSAQMDPLLPELADSLKDIRPEGSSIPFFSTVTKGLVDGRDLTPTYWTRNLREPVLFADTIETMLDEGYEVFLELSPRSVLAGAITRCISGAGHDGVAIPSLKQGEEERAAMLAALGAIYTMGLPLNWSALNTEGCRCVPLPHYPWQRERYWLELDGLDDAGRDYRLAGAHPLLGRHLEAAQHAGTHFWESELSLQFLPYLADHKLQGAALLPGTAYVEMALAGAREVFGGAPFALTEIEFKKALFLGEADRYNVQTIFYPGAPGHMHFRVYSSPAGDTKQGSWTLHATGQARVGHERETETPAAPATPEEIQALCTEEISGAEYYSALRSRGFDYGPAFQGVERIWYHAGEALGRISVPQSLDGDPGEYQLHPAVFDACAQVLGAASNVLAGSESDGLYIPVSFAQVRMFGSAGTHFWAHVTLRDETHGGSDSIRGDIRILDDEGRVLVEVQGVRCVRLERASGQEAERRIGDWFYEVEWQPTPLPNQESLEAESASGRWLILSDSAGVGTKLKDLLEARGGSCVIVTAGEGFEKVSDIEYQVCARNPEDFNELSRSLSESDAAAWRGVIHLWNLDLPLPEERADYAWEPQMAHGCISLLHLVQALARSEWSEASRLWVVTRGAQSIGDETGVVAISQAPASGLGGVIASEIPNLRCSRIDLDPEGEADEVHQLLSEFLLDESEGQLAFRQVARHVPRLVRSSRDGDGADSSLDSPAGKSLELPGTESFRLEISPPYVLDNLALRPVPRRKPGRGEVEIQVLAAGLNFRDVLKAMGLYPGISGQEVRLGDECAGRIVDVGEGVEGYRVGDEVVAIAHNGFSSFVTVDTHFVVPKPDNLSFEETAAIPVAFSTAYYALSHIGRLAKGERILIHAAAGGVGLAAIGLAQSLGAEIFATAGSPEKREYLKSLGVQHVMDSRSLDWAQEVMRLTNDEGVDIVLNSLAGEAIGAGLASLRAFGRFVEIGKIDIYENSRLGLYPFRNNVAFSAVDMEQVFLHRPELSQSILSEIMGRFERGDLKPLPHKTFPVTDSAGAFRYMAQRKNTGKIIISFEQLDKNEDERPHAQIRPDYTYLVTGGLGGLGLEVARYLVESGARHLALIGRSEPSGEAAEALGSMREAGVSLYVGKGDVADEDQLARIMAEVASQMPPVKGIVHAAGVLDDGILLQQDEARFYKVLRPKVAGAWNLHALSSGMELDFFVLFSSVAAIFSNPGQGNYVAANAFLDALAHYRLAKGLPALSINWGPWAEVGMAAHLDRQRLEARGMGSIAPEEGVRALEMLMGHRSPQVAVMPINRAVWARLSQASSISSLVSLMARGDVAAQPGADESPGAINRNTILNAEVAERPKLLEEYMRNAGGRVLGLATAKLDLEQPLNRMGIDSLMAVELKNRIEADLGIDLPVLKVLEGASLSQLASFLSERFAASTA
jgi:acyl transferase domain-containing protein/NADPH:quinone reductase-like Zn-dependent oxidoreductase/NAD(P)-dependent dehydrogenase (short-subunit alcohol dehydrogenase family)/acyl carrier protein